MAMIQKAIKAPEASEKTQVFLSYHFCKLDNPLVQGFGNMVAEFNTEAYRGRMGDFVTHLENHVKQVLESQLGFKIQARVLFFR